MQDTGEKSKIPDVPSYLCRLLARGGMKEELKKDGKCSIYGGQQIDAQT